MREKTHAALRHQGALLLRAVDGGRSYLKQADDPNSGIGAASVAFPVTRTRLSFGPVAPWQIGVE